MDGLTLLEVYVGAEKIWPTVKEVVQITLGTGTEARDQLRAALTARGLDYQTVTEIPFDIELVGSGSTQFMFSDCAALTSVPDLITSQVTSMFYMFDGCVSLTDGNVRLIGRNPNVSTTGMITGSGLTREPWYTPDGKPIDVYQVALTDKRGAGTLHPMVSVTVPAGQTWHVHITGTVTKASSMSSRPQIQIGGTLSDLLSKGATVDLSGTITSTSPTIALRTNSGFTDSSFTGTVTIEK